MFSSPAISDPRRQGEAAVWAGHPAGRAREVQHVILKVKIFYQKKKNILYNTLLFRLQKEKEDAYTDIDRGREKYEKLQVIRLNCTEYFQQVFIFPAISWIVRQSKSPYLWLWLSSVSALSPDINSDICVTPLWDLTGASEDWQCPTSYFFCFSLRTQCASFLVE